MSRRRSSRTERPYRELQRSESGIYSQIRIPSSARFCLPRHLLMLMEAKHTRGRRHARMGAPG